MSRFLPVALAVVLATTATACRDDSDGSNGTFQTIDDGPAGIEDVVQHLAEPPAYPAPVTDEPELAELRSPDSNRRHHFYLAAFDVDGTLEDTLVRGSAVRLLEGASLDVPDGASVARLGGTTVTEVVDCEAPCSATGPALVAPPEWLQGIRAAADWELVVPAPSE